MTWLLYIINALLVPALSPLVIGLIRKLKARMQSRIGPGVFQPYRDLAKLLRKNEVVSSDASWVFLLAPYIVFGSTLAIAAGIPLINPSMVLPATGDFLVFVYLLALGTFFLALGGIDTGSGFGGFGASREMLFAALTEGGLILSLATVALVARAADLAAITIALSRAPEAAFLPIAIAAAAFFIALLSENARYPVDNPATHLELTMVHEAMILEYSGKRLALMEWASANKLLIFIAVFGNIFLPFGSTLSYSAGALAAAALVFLAKVAAVAAGIAFVESSMSKYRIFRVPDLLFTSFVLGAIAMLIAVL